MEETCTGMLKKAGEHSTTKINQGDGYYGRTDPRVLNGTAEGAANRPDTPQQALLLSPGYSLAEVSSEPGSKKVTFLPSPGFFTGVLKIKGK